MHSALLIDEVLQLIFDFCSDLPDTEPKWTYAQLARCCRAWKDPALDRLWDRLNGVGPLLALMATQEEDGQQVRDQVFEEAGVEELLLAKVLTIDPPLGRFRYLSAAHIHGPRQENRSPRRFEECGCSPHAPCRLPPARVSHALFPRLNGAA